MAKVRKGNVKNLSEQLQTALVALRNLIDRLPPPPPKKKPEKRKPRGHVKRRRPRRGVFKSNPHLVICKSCKRTYDDEYFSHDCGGPTGRSYFYERQSTRPYHVFQHYADEGPEDEPEWGLDFIDGLKGSERPHLIRPIYGPKKPPAKPRPPSL